MGCLGPCGVGVAARGCAGAPRWCETESREAKRSEEKRNQAIRRLIPGSPTMLATASPHLQAAAARRLSLAVPVNQGCSSVRLPRRRPGRYASVRAASASASASASAAAPPAKEGAEDLGFQEMSSGTRRRYYMLGGKGGDGKTSCAASLAVRFANNGHPTLVVSTDPAHSLSDSFAQVAHPAERLCFLRHA